MSNTGKCKQCGKNLTPDEEALHKKIYNRGAVSYFCLDCSAEYLQVERTLLEQKIVEFKEMGCTLFIRE